MAKKLFVRRECIIEKSKGKKAFWRVLDNAEISGDSADYGKQGNERRMKARGKWHGCAGNHLSHHKSAKRPDKHQSRMEENGKFRTQGKAYHKPFLFARFAGFGLIKVSCFSRGVDDRLAEDETRLLDPFYCGNRPFGGCCLVLIGPDAAFAIGHDRSAGTEDRFR
ncbi:MAG: hypothetical protein ACI4QT_07495, partial [Kiritimatiellia bacterium]